jgi:hypothetical protein
MRSNLFIRLLSITLVAMAMACNKSGTSSLPDGSVTDAAPTDASGGDAVLTDAAPTDANGADTGMMDATPADASGADAGLDTAAIKRAIQAELDQLAMVVRAKGMALAPSDVLPFVDTGFSFGGVDAMAFATGSAQFLPQFAPLAGFQLLAADVQTTADPTVVHAPTTFTSGPNFKVTGDFLYKQQADLATWKLYGDQRVIGIRLASQYTRSSDPIPDGGTGGGGGACGTDPSLELQASFSAVQDMTGQINVDHILLSGPGIADFTFDATNLDQGVRHDFGVPQSSWSKTWCMPGLQSGSVYTVAVTLKQGTSPAPYTIDIGQVITEPINIIQPTSHTIGSVIGQMVEFQWTPLATVTPGQLQACWQVYGPRDGGMPMTGGSSYTCSGGPGATAFDRVSVQIPSTVDGGGAPARAQVVLVIDNGQSFQAPRTQTTFTFQ